MSSTASLQDHPRSRGVYDVRPGDAATFDGSSPLARGLLFTPYCAVKAIGIIPARAGFTCWSEMIGSRWWDHPRSRGVYSTSASVNASGAGSSPLARGLPRRGHGREIRRRIIPARAGFTRRRAPPARSAWDHPRSRGVYGPYSEDCYPDDGSSPLARGLRSTPEQQGSGSRIIPARAGFTATGSANSRTPGDHPRSRGVYTGMLPCSARMAGSSPLARGLRPLPSTGSDSRMDHPRSRGVYEPEGGWKPDGTGSSPLARGLLFETGEIGMGVRIIPARAGFTRWLSASTGRPADHPRSRGVYGQRELIVVRGCGSSPLARGLRPPSGPPPGSPRIIPARAGFTVLGGEMDMRLSDHPRSRGVYTTPNDNQVSLVGSSPLARGLPHSRGGSRRSGRIIPARAGFTCSR